MPISEKAFVILFEYSDLSDLAMEAAQNDGRLARRPLKNSSREIQAHDILLSRITQLIEEYNASIEVNECFLSPSRCLFGALSLSFIIK